MNHIKLNRQGRGGVAKKNKRVAPVKKSEPITKLPGEKAIDFAIRKAQNDFSDLLPDI